MSEPVHIFNLPVIGLTSGVSGNMAASITSKAAYLDESAGFCAQAVFTGTPVGTIEIQGSNDPVNLGYTTITESVTAISAAGSYMINVEFPYYAYVQIVYSRASGTGTMVASINSKKKVIMSQVFINIPDNNSGGGGGAPSGPAGGDLTGTYPNPIVATIDGVPASTIVAAISNGTPNTFAGYDSTGLLSSVPGWTVDSNGQVDAFLTGVPSDSTNLIQLGATVSTPLTAGAEGVIVNYTFSSTMGFQSSYNAENIYQSGFTLTGSIGQFQDQSQFNSGSSASNYVSFEATPTINGMTNYNGVSLNPILTGSTTYTSMINANPNYNSGYANTGNIQTFNDGSQIKSGASVVSYTSYNAGPTLNGTLTGEYFGLNIFLNNTTVPPATSMTGVGVDFSQVSPPSYLPIGLNISQGSINQNATLDTQHITPSSVYGVNQIGGTIQVSSGFPINAGQFGFGNNIGVALVANDNVLVDSTGVDLGLSSVGFVTEVEIASGKNVATFNLMTAGAGIPAGSGSITNASMFRALGFLPEGGTLAIHNLFGFKSDPIIAAVGATNAWGFYEGSGSDNFFSKIAIGTTTQKVTNSSVALEIGNQKGVVFANVTTVQKLALTAVPGMQVFDTTLSQMSYYNGTIWINF